jgi:hypothetical protein
MPPTSSPGSRRWFLLFLAALAVGLVGTGGLVITGLFHIYAPIALGGAIAIWVFALRAVSARRSLRT